VLERLWVVILTSSNHSKGSAWYNDDLDLDRSGILLHIKSPEDSGLLQCESTISLELQPLPIDLVHICKCSMWWGGELGCRVWVMERDGPGDERRVRNQRGNLVDPGNQYRKECFNSTCHYLPPVRKKQRKKKKGLLW
jgi:hypothetical protein